MLDAAREAVELVRGRSVQQIEGDRLRVLALERLFGSSHRKTGSPNFFLDFDRLCSSGRH
jgi:hypothetical protein